MKRKVRKKPEQEPEKEPVVIMVDKEKVVEKEKMSPVEKERQGMKTEEPGEAMTPLKK